VRGSRRFQLDQDHKAGLWAGSHNGPKTGPMESVSPGLFVLFSLPVWAWGEQAIANHSDRMG
jgi:hypothetical protein